MGKILTAHFKSEISEPLQGGHLQKNQSNWVTEMQEKQVFVEISISKEMSVYEYSS